MLGVLGYLGVLLDALVGGGLLGGVGATAGGLRWG